MPWQYRFMRLKHHDVVVSYSDQGLSKYLCLGTRPRTGMNAWLTIGTREANLVTSFEKGAHIWMVADCMIPF
jgi:hypothetical protein